MTITQMYNLEDPTPGDTLAQVGAQVLAAPATFGLSVAQATEMSDSAELFNEALAAWNAARIAADTASFDKQTQRETSLAVFSQYLNLMYANPSVSSSSILSLGFAPRSTSKTPILPFIPQEPFALPSADGSVKVSWKAGDNKYGVIYEVEVSDADESNWTLLASTTKTRLTFNDFAPGVPKWFRIRATKNGEVSPYSVNAGIYIPAPGFGLEEAA
ncbi:MAG TPA: fibronectin type III domain-containing protein [Fimbriimonadaceae bacterium]|nr:fibronectin type III domain-containing protein [Fimbriimonadaceae bacterium]